MIFDIDGTLVNNDHQFSQKIYHILKKLSQKNIMLGLASGRTTGQLKKHLAEWNLSDCFQVLIGINGATLYDGLKDESFEFFKLKKEWMREILEMMSIFNANCHIYDDECSIYLYDDPLVDVYRKQGRKVIIAHTIENMCAHEVPKILYRADIEDSKKMEAYAKERCNENYTVVRTQPNIIEFVCTGCSKAYALEYFCKSHQIPLSDVASFGDTSNDNEMLAISGLGVCMKNGSEDTKKIADVITDKTNEEDGLAYFLEQMIKEF